MLESSRQNKAAWEYNAYDFWVKEAGTPQNRAEHILMDPMGALKRYAAYFESFKGIRIANICGSCGKKRFLWRFSVQRFPYLIFQKTIVNMQRKWQKQLESE